MWKKTTQSTSDLSPKHQTSEIYLRISHLMSCQNIRSGKTGVNVPELLVQSRGRAAELHLCFVTKGNVWWKRTFLPMVTIVVLHHKYEAVHNKIISDPPST